jgi:hypothetical protein
MSELNQTIKELYQGNISDWEVELAKDNFLEFQTKTPQNAPQNAIQSTF